MNTNKLGLKFVRISQGYTDLFEINGDSSWTQHVWDIREELKLIDNLNSDSNIVFSQNIEEGHILTVVYPFMVQGHGATDCISAWVFVPKDIVISGKELSDVVKYLRDEMLSNNLNQAKLEQVFAKEYPASPAKKVITQTSGTVCAYRYYGQGQMYSLSEILGELNQATYAKYKCIFILDKASGFEFNKNIDNLSASKVTQMVVVNPPKPVDKFVPYIDGEIFEEAVYIAEGSLIKVEWKRPGYRTIDMAVTVSKNSVIPQPTPDKYYRNIRFDHFTIVDESNNPVGKYQLRVSKQTLNEGFQVVIHEAAISKCEVEVFADNFVTFKETLDLNSKQIIRMKRRTLTYKFKLPLKDGSSVDIPYEATKKLVESPIRGYETIGAIDSGHINDLEYKPDSKRTYIMMLIGFVAGLVLGIGAMLIFGGESETSASNQTKQESTEEKQEKTSSESTLEEAIKYLDEKKTWNRDEMEGFKELAGLWDALNTYKFDKIREYDLSKSKNFTKLLEVIKDKNNLDKTRCEEGDFNIDIARYINSLTSAPKTPSNPTNGNANPEQNNTESNKAQRDPSVV